MQAPKSGFFYVLDRKTGELLSAEKYTAVNWASHIDLKTGRPVVNPARALQHGAGARHAGPGRRTQLVPDGVQPRYEARLFPGV